MRKVICSLFLVLLFSSFVLASSITVGFTIRGDTDIYNEIYTPSLSNYIFYLIAVMSALIALFVLLKKDKKLFSIKSKKTSSKKKIKSKKK